jgi:hypothetical protein
LALSTLQIPLTNAARRLVCPKRMAIERSARSLALLLMLIALWSLTHRYEGLGGDAALYAMQALARIHSNLRNDLFLRNASQDSYTVFSCFYAWWIGLLGLRTAALSLTIAFKVWFFAAAWMLASDLSNRQTASLTVGLLIVTAGAYGAYGVFHYAEDWLTARSLAEPMVLTALVVFVRGARIAGLLIACAALLVHPLVAIAGVLVLLCLLVSPRASAVGAAAGVLILFTLSLDALRPASHLHQLVMDSDWLEVVRERSQFLFLQLWRAADWKKNALPFLSLALSASVLDDPRTRRLCYCAILVGATGLAVALIGGLIGPLSILLQGQAWRWVWVTGIVSALLLAPTVLALAHHRESGILIAILMISSWAVPAIDGAACMACALVCWSVRDRINDRAVRVLSWANALLVAVIIAWVIERCWALWRSPSAVSGYPLPWGHAREILGLNVLSLVIVWSLASWVNTSRSTATLTVVCAAFLAVSVVFLPGSLRDRDRDGTASQIDEFSDWRNAIPADANVFVVPAHNSAKFAWFTLERPSYLTVDQSSGVVFSRATAVEVRRRSEVLRSLMDPDWKLLSNMAKAHSSNGGNSPSSAPITRELLIGLCSDPQLNFVIARQNVGFDPIRHEGSGPWKDWNLYDCRRVIAGVPPA